MYIFIYYKNIVVNYKITIYDCMGTLSINHFLRISNNIQGYYKIL